MKKLIVVLLVLICVPCYGWEVFTTEDGSDAGYSYDSEYGGMTTYDSLEDNTWERTSEFGGVTWDSEGTTTINVDPDYITESAPDLRF